MSDTTRVSTSPSSKEPTLWSGGRSVIEVQAEKRHAVIIPMDISSVQRIVAGQAITDLASAVKELIDNALDAGSKTINIRLFNQGLDIVEVSDDGCGVPIESRPYMAMKHATSKICQFDDIYSTDSLGFRGEALFCLANISGNLVVATRTADETLGQKLEFTREGHLRHDTACPVPRKVGTTVAVVKLFDALPVRRSDLEKRIQVQRREVFLMVQGYAIHCLGVKFNLFDISSNGREELQLSTMQGTSKLEETISSVLGSTFLSGMSRISINLPVDDTDTWGVEGLISKAPHLTARDGSVARNAQFFSLNGRPVDLPKVSRTISDAWRTLQVSNKKKPACVLHFRLPKKSCDVNLAPNKRQVLLTDEEKICAWVHEGVLALWNSQRDGQFLLNELDIRKGNVDAATFVDDMSPQGRKVKRRLGFYNDFRHVKLQHDSETTQLQGCSNNQLGENSSLSPNGMPHGGEGHKDNVNMNGHDRTSDTNSIQTEGLEKATDADRRLFVQVQERFRKDQCHDEVQPFASATITPQEKDHKDVRHSPLDEIISTKQSLDTDLNAIRGSGTTHSKRSRVLSDDSDTAPPKKKAVTMQDFGFRSSEKLTTSVNMNVTPELSASLPKTARALSTPLPIRNRVTASERNTAVVVGQGKNNRPSIPSDEEAATDTSQLVDEEEELVEWTLFQGTDSIIQASRSARLELHDRRNRLKLLKAERQKGGRSCPNEKTDVDHQINVDDDSKHSTVSLTKQDFEGMCVIGQFNLGFIVTKCRNNNLWVLDQHACDEKYNFERLCASTVIQEQKLLVPMPLELSPAEEACIHDNLEIFEKNGFRFEYREDMPPRHHFALTSLPHSGAQDGRKAVQFGKDDVRALCAVLGADGMSYSQDGGTGVDGSGMYGNNAVRRYAGLSQNGEKIMTRLPKAVAMFANRACRSSVMIGTALSKKEMEVIVQRLANVEQPWNCPHGRPTLKHVKDLLVTEANDTHRTLNHTVGPTIASMPEITQQDTEN